MLFNSVDFIYFFLVVVVIYAIVPFKWKWLTLLVSSYYFYMSWNVDFVILIVFTTAISYYCAIKIEDARDSSEKKIFLLISILSSISILFFFKYFNFVAGAINGVFSVAGRGDIGIPALSLLLPVGISFYTFQTLSYTIDVYYGKVISERHFGIYALFVSFFPQLVAGPIERSSSLLPQFRVDRPLSLDNFIVGSKFMIIGFFMKLAVADRLALYVDAVYSNVDNHSGGSIAVATFFFAIQIFCDFAGYSSIALGVAKCFGFDLMVNFQRPYFAKSITEFWRRWHVSLSTWFKDYVYIPLGGNRVKVHVKYLNLFLTFLISGLWHGANWTFVLWGAFHGALLVAENILGLRNISNSAWNLLRSLVVFLVVCFGWMLFRANSISDASLLISRLTEFSVPFYADYKTFFYGSIGISTLFTVEYLTERKPNGWTTNARLDFGTVFFFGMLTILTLFIGVLDGGQFIYFQF